MTVARPSPQDLPLGPTLLCLFATSWVSSAVVSAAFAGRAYPAGVPPAAFLVGVGLVEALVGAVVIRALLSKVVGCDISYGAAFVALAGGSLASTAFVWATSTAVQHSGNPAVVPSGGLVFGFVPAIASMAVSYWLLQLGAGDRALAQAHTGRTADPDGASDAGADEAPALDSLSTRLRLGGASYSDLVSAARETSLSLVEAVSRGTPEEVPDQISEGLPPLQAITDKLGSATPPAAVPARLHQQLVAGMTQLQEDLVDTASSAASTAEDHITQRGWLLPSSVDVSDGGTRYRWELSQSEGLKRVREALGELNTLGIGTSWEIDTRGRSSAAAGSATTDPLLRARAAPRPASRLSMRTAWPLVTILIIGAVAVTGYLAIHSRQKQDLGGVGATAALLNKVAHQRPAHPHSTPSAPRASGGLRAYQSEVSAACRTLAREVAAIPPATPARLRLQRLARSMDSFVSVLVPLTVPATLQTAAASLLSAAKLYGLHVQLALQEITSGNTSAERMDLVAARPNSQDFGVARRALGVSCAI